MTIDELAAESLVDKRRRLRQQKCWHKALWCSTVAGPEGTFSNSFCLACGASWHRRIGRMPQ